MAAPLVERDTGDVIPASDHNDVKDYIEDAAYRVNTESLSIGGSQIIDSDGNITSNVGSGHDNFSDFVSDEHIDHSTVSISAGTGLSGGGDITSDRTISLDADLNNLSDINISSASDDDLLAYDSGSGGWVNQTKSEAGFATVASSGSYDDLSDKPSDVTDMSLYDIDDLSDVDTSGVEDNKILKYNSTSGNFEIADDENTTYESSDFDHDNLTNTHNLTTDIDHNQLTNYSEDEHRTIDDSGTSTTDLWSADKINSELEDKADSSDLNDYVPYSGADSNVDLGSNDLTTTGNITADNLNISDWNTAYGWGDHSTEGYLTDITGESIRDLNDVQDTSPSDGDVLKWNDSESRYEPAEETDTTYSAGTGITINQNEISTNDMEIDHDGLANSHQDVTTDGTPSFVSVTFDRAHGKVQDEGNIDSDQSINWSDASHFKATLSQDTSISFLNKSEGQKITIMLEYDDSSQRSVSWSDVKWAGGSAPDTPSASGEVLVATFFFDGSNTYGDGAIFS